MSLVSATVLDEWSSAEYDPALTPCDDPIQFPPRELNQSGGELPQIGGNLS